MSSLRTTLKEIVDDAASRLDPAPLRVIHIGIGQMAVSDTGCGQIHARVVSVVPLMSTQPGATKVNCGILGYTVTCALNVQRCVATVTDHGSPSAKQIEDDGIQLLADMNACVEAIVAHSKTRSVVGWTPMAEQGAIAGGEWLFTIRLGVS
jgi:hypothetical protein